MTSNQVYDNGGLELREIKGLRAIPAGPAATAVKGDQEVLSGLENEARDQARQILNHEDRAAFAADGWIVAADTETALNAAAGVSGAENAGGHRLFLDTQDNAQIETPVVSLKLQSGLDEEQVAATLRELEVRPLRRLGFAPNLFEVESSSAQTLSLELASRLRDHPAVDFAEPQLLERTKVRLRPADPGYVEQWQWRAIGAEAAWDRTQGAGIRIAVIDLGMDVAHLDLRAGVRGGGSFQKEDGKPSRFVSRISDPAGFPNHPHGTFCLGMAGARINGTAGCGAAPEAFLVPIAIDARLGNQTTLARALSYAAEPSLEERAPGQSGADIISCSLAPPNATVLGPTLATAIDYVVNQGRGGKGTPIFWAVDNANVRIARDRICSHPSVNAVGMSSRHDAWAGSATGPELEFLAPGLAVSSVLPNRGFGHDTGTSYATPCAAGVAALVLALEPQLKWDQVRDRLRGTCDKIGLMSYAGPAFNGRNNRHGYGRINASRAVGL